MLTNLLRLLLCVGFKVHFREMRKFTSWLFCCFWISFHRFFESSVFHIKVFKIYWFNILPSLFGIFYCSLFRLCHFCLLLNLFSFGFFILEKFFVKICFFFVYFWCTWYLFLFFFLVLYLREFCLIYMSMYFLIIIRSHTIKKQFSIAKVFQYDFSSFCFIWNTSSCHISF